VICVSCPKCGKSYRLPPRSAGKRGTCRQCQTQFSIPADDSAGRLADFDFSEEPSALGERLNSNELLRLLAESVEFPRQPLTAGHQLAALLVACVMLALPIFYLLFIVGIAWVTWWHATHNYVWLGYADGHPIPFAPFLYGGLIAAGVLWILSLIKPLFLKFGNSNGGATVAREDEPVLFEFAERLADKVGAPRPEAIRLTALVNAAASYEVSPFNLEGRKFTLILGMPLVAGMTLSQLAGVMAHEFGHFSQQRGMLLLGLIYRVNSWFGMAVYGKDAIDWATQFLVRSGHIFLIVPGLALWVLVALGRSVLWLLMHVGLLASASLMRRREFDADCYEIGLVGSSEFAETHRRLAKLGLAYKIAAGYVTNSRQCISLPSDFVAFIVDLADRSPDVKVLASAMIKTEKEQWMSSHPPTRARIQAAKKLNLPGAFHAPIPGTSIFETFDERCISISGALYRLIYRSALAGKPVCSSHEAADYFLDFVASHRRRR
jgi:Zn-dependent protease with chaperone function